MNDRKIETVGYTTGRTIGNTTIGPRPGTYDKYAKEKGPVELEIDEFLEKERSTGCVLCGADRRLRFHHRDPRSRKFRIANSPHGATIAKLRGELKKCVVVCQRCHTLIHNETPPPSYIQHKDLFKQLQRAIQDAKAAKTPLN